MATYTLFVTAYRNGRITDSGAQAQREFPNDQIAITEFKSDIMRQPVCTTNDKVNCKVRAGHRNVGEFTL